MRYVPLTALEKNKHIGKNWTWKQLDMVEKARRVIGFWGTFPPYKGLIDKINKANGFNEAFKLRPKSDK